MDPSLTMDWMSLLRDRLLESFGDRVVFIGLQGSRARGEADQDSDIDAVVILDTLSVGDLGTYRGILDRMPHRKLACGFVSGMDEIARWDPADLFQFRMDTVPILGDLDSILLWTPSCLPWTLMIPGGPLSQGPVRYTMHACTTTFTSAPRRSWKPCTSRRGSYSGPSTTARPACS